MAAFGVFGEAKHTYGSEGGIQGLLGGLQAGVHQTDEGDSVVNQGIADGSIAALGIPAYEALLAEAHASEDFLARSECQARGKSLNHVRSALGIQRLGRFAQEVREGLAVSAITHGAVDALRKADGAFESSALTLQWMTHAAL